MLITQVLRLYQDTPLSARAHVLIRYLLCPMLKILESVPQDGRFLEIGCGHGLFSNLAAVSRPKLQVLGIDLAEEKIRWAQVSAKDRTNVAFRCQKLEDLQENNFDVTAILDVLYLIPKKAWQGFLTAAVKTLKPGGKLLIKENTFRPEWKFRFAIFQEMLSVNFLKITVGSSDFSFADPVEMAELLKSLGCKDVKVSRIDRGYWYPHILYEATC